MRQKGFAPVLLLVAIILVGFLIYFPFSFNKPILTTSQETPEKENVKVNSNSNSNQYELPPLPSPQPKMSIPNSWKTYDSKDNIFSFRYPDIWYFEENPNYPTDTSFFLEGTMATFGYADYTGNETIAISYVTNESTTLEELKQEYFPNAFYLNIAGYYAIKTGAANPLYIVQLSDRSQLNFMVFKNSEAYIDKIVSSLEVK